MMRHSRGERVPMGHALRILLDEQAIKRRTGKSIEGRHAPIHLKGIAAMGLSMLINQLPEMLQGEIDLITCEHTK